jgi:hypothetical protein
MNTTLSYLRGRRAWMVERLTVWGAESEAQVLMAAMETVGSDNRLGFWQVALGGHRQEVTFADLVDNRGNHLPDQIKKPTVIIVPRESNSAYVNAVRGEAGFIVAKSDSGGKSVVVDLLIFETGL